MAAAPPHVGAAAAAASLYAAEVGGALAAERARLAQLQDAQELVSSSASLVADLPSRLSHAVCVPFGRHAFFLGHLRHTNELTVHLGARHYARCTAAHAAGVLRRRCGRLDGAIAACQRQVSAHEARLRLAGSELGVGSSGVGEGGGGAPPTEIRQSWEDSEALLATARARRGAPPAAPASAAAGPAPGPGPPAAAAQAAAAAGDAEFAALFARMDELEAAEAAAAAGGAQPGGEQDGEEEEEEEEEGVLDVPYGAGSTASFTGRLGRVEEVDEPDSDDEDEGAEGPGEGQAAGVWGRPAPPTQQPQPKLGPPPPPGQPSAKPLTAPATRSALKKGFLAPPPSKQGHAGAPAHAAAAAAAAGADARLASSRAAAFTGEVVERCAPLLPQPPLQQQGQALPGPSGRGEAAGVPGHAAGAVEGHPRAGGRLEPLQAPLEGAGGAGEAPRKQLSKFKQKMMGMG